MHANHWNEFSSLDQLNRSLITFINEYHNKTHSSLKTTPLNRFRENLESINYIAQSELEEHFLHRETRKVKNDSTISLRSLAFEVPSEFI